MMGGESLMGNSALWIEPTFSLWKITNTYNPEVPIHDFLSNIHYCLNTIYKNKLQ